MGVLLYRLDRVDRRVNRGSYLFFSHCPNLSHSLKFNSWPSHSNSVTIPVDRVGPDLSTTVGQKKNTIFPLPIFRDCTECPSNYKTNYIDKLYIPQHRLHCNCDKCPTVNGEHRPYLSESDCIAFITCARAFLKISQHRRRAFAAYLKVYPGNTLLY